MWKHNYNFINLSLYYGRNGYSMSKICRDLKTSKFEFFDQKNFFSSSFFLWFSLSFAERTKFLRDVVSEIEKI